MISSVQTTSFIKGLGSVFKSRFGSVYSGTVPQSANNCQSNSTFSDSVLQKPWCPSVIKFVNQILRILRGTINIFPSNAFLRRRCKKALLRVNDRGGGWRMCTLALCCACVCARVFCTYVRAPLSN